MTSNGEFKTRFLIRLTTNDPHKVRQWFNVRDLVNLSAVDESINNDPRADGTYVIIFRPQSASDIGYLLTLCLERYRDVNEYSIISEISDGELSAVSAINHRGEQMATVVERPTTSEAAQNLYRETVKMISRLANMVRG